jgi:hypothetical protein
LNSVSRTRSGVGRSPGRSGTSSLDPRRRPAMTRILRGGCGIGWHPAVRMRRFWE